MTFHSKPVHSLMLSSHRFLCLPLCLPPCTFPCRIVLTSPDGRVTCLCHFSLCLLPEVRRSSMAGSISQATIDFKVILLAVSIIITVTILFSNVCWNESTFHVGKRKSKLSSSLCLLKKQTNKQTQYSDLISATIPVLIPVQTQDTQARGLWPFLTSAEVTSSSPRYFLLPWKPHRNREEK